MTKCLWPRRVTPSFVTRSIGCVWALVTSLALAAYLIFLKEGRGAVKFHFNIEGCDDNVFVESVVDSMLEYSLISNLLLVISFNKFVVAAWLIIHGLTLVILLFLCLPVLILSESELAVYFIIATLVVFGVLLACWITIAARFDQVPFLNTSIDRIKFSVKIFCGTFAFLACLAMCVDILMKHYQIRLRFFRRTKDVLLEELFSYVDTTFLLAATTIVHLGVVAGCDGARWRRSLLVPWLLCHGLVIIACFFLHQWFTTYCWAREKLYGLVSLVVGACSVILWTSIWWVAAY